MNVTGCPQGYFSDQIYNYYAVPGACDGVVDLFLWGMVTIIAIRLSIFTEIVRLWRKARSSDSSRRKNRGGQRFRFQRRIPIIPTLHFASCIAILLVFLLTYSNVATAATGTTHLLLVVWVTPFVLIEGLALRKMVALGRRIIPWNGAMHGDDLSRFDLRLRILTRLMVVLFAITWIAVVIGCLNDPRLFGRISLSALFAHQILLFSSLVYQYERCLRCIKATLNSQRQQSETLVHAKKRLVGQQVILCLCGFSTSACLGFFAITLAAPYWGLMLSFIIELLSYGFMAATFADRQHEQTQPRSTLFAAPVAADVVADEIHYPEVCLSPEKEPERQKVEDDDVTVAENPPSSAGVEEVVTVNEENVLSDWKSLSTPTEGQMLTNQSLKIDNASLKQNEDAARA